MTPEQRGAIEAIREMAQAHRDARALCDAPMIYIEQRCNALLDNDG